LWALETERGNWIELHLFHAEEKDVDEKVKEILAAHPNESFN
jgi:hypothetical protein